MSHDVVIHVKFAADGEVTDIGERPATRTPQAWFNLLSLRAGTRYQTLAGGRGVFRLARSDVDAFAALTD